MMMIKNCDEDAEVQLSSCLLVGEGGLSYPEGASQWEFDYAPVSTWISEFTDSLFYRASYTIAMLRQ